MFFPVIPKYVLGDTIEEGGFLIGKCLYCLESKIS